MRAETATLVRAALGRKHKSSVLSGRDGNAGGRSLLEPAGPARTDHVGARHVMAVTLKIPIAQANQFLAQTRRSLKRFAAARVAIVVWENVTKIDLISGWVRETIP